MRQATLKRAPSTPDGTFGVFSTDGFTMVTGELPWMNNQRGVSCILPGPNDKPITYTCRWLFSPKHGRNVYHVLGTQGRDDVEMHVGNFCGDVSLGKKSDVLGCIIGGKYEAPMIPPGLPAQNAVWQSTATMAAFEAHMNQEDFQLTILWG